MLAVLSIEFAVVKDAQIDGRIIEVAVLEYHVCEATFSPFAIGKNTLTKDCSIYSRSDEAGSGEVGLIEKAIDDLGLR